MSTTSEKEPKPEFDGILERHGQRPPVYFMVLFLGLIVWGVIFAAYYLLSGWSSQQEFQEKMTAHQQQVAATEQTAQAAAPATETISVAATNDLFSQNCAVCHGAAGKGGIGPDLTQSTFKYGRTPTDVTTSISEGRSGGMPAFGNQLSKAQIAALAEHVLALK